MGSNVLKGEYLRTTRVLIPTSCSLASQKLNYAEEGASRLALMKAATWMTMESLPPTLESLYLSSNASKSRRCGLFITLDASVDLTSHRKSCERSCGCASYIIHLMQNVVEDGMKSFSV